MSAQRPYVNGPVRADRRRSKHACPGIESPPFGPLGREGIYVVVLRAEIDCSVAGQSRRRQDLVTCLEFPPQSAVLVDSVQMGIVRADIDATAVADSRRRNTFAGSLKLPLFPAGCTVECINVFVVGGDV